MIHQRKISKKEHGKSYIWNALLDYSAQWFMLYYAVLEAWLGNLWLIHQMDSVWGDKYLQGWSECQVVNLPWLFGRDLGAVCCQLNSGQCCSMAQPPFGSCLPTKINLCVGPLEQWALWGWGIFSLCVQEHIWQESRVTYAIYCGKLWKQLRHF